MLRPSTATTTPEPQKRKHKTLLRVFHLEHEICMWKTTHGSLPIIAGSIMDAYHLSACPNLSASVIRQFFRTERAVNDQTIPLWRAGSFLPETELWIRQHWRDGFADWLIRPAVVTNGGHHMSTKGTQCLLREMGMLFPVFRHYRNTNWVILFSRNIHILSLMTCKQCHHTIFFRAILARGRGKKEKTFLFPYAHFSFPSKKQNGGHNTDNPYVRICLHCKLQAHGHCYFESTRWPVTIECRPFLKWMLKWYYSFYRRTGHLMFAKTLDRLLAMQTSCRRQK